MLISPLSIAPMIDWTNTPFRIFMRILAPNALVYTEMQTLGAILHAPKRALDFVLDENPIALQMGGSDIQQLRQAMQIIKSYQYDEINLNLGCPSAKVQAGQFGACLMREPKLVQALVQTMKENSALPITAKIRIGVDEHESYQHFYDFAAMLVEAGCDKLIIHARKAWLNGLNPKQNRTIPPVNYPFVYRFKKEFPHIPIVINGDIKTLDAVHQHLDYVDGVMLGRIACDNPYEIAKISAQLFSTPMISRVDALETYLTYAKQLYAHGWTLGLLLKPIMNLSHGLANGKQYKHQLTAGLLEKNWDKISSSLTLLSDS